MTTTSTRTSLLTVALASAALAAGVASAPPASAGAAPHRVVHHDARGDVIRFDVESETQRPAPRDRTSDVVRTVVDHRADDVVLQSRVRELSRSGYRLMIADLLTPQGRRYELVVDYSTRPIDRRVSLTRSGSGTEIACAGTTWSVDRATGSIEATVPRSCLGDPAWIRAGLAVVAAPRDLESSRADDSRARGRIGDERLRLGPRQPAA